MRNTTDRRGQRPLADDRPIPRPSQSERRPGQIQDPELLRRGHQQLVHAVTGLLVEKGFHSTSLREVADVVGWSMGNIYKYIDRKEDILQLISENVMVEFYEQVVVDDSESPAVDTLTTVIERLVRHCDHRRAEVQLLYRESSSMLPEALASLKNSERAMVGIFERIIRHGVDTGEFRPTNTRLIAHDIVILGHMWALKGWELFTYVDLNEYIRIQTRLVLCALGVAVDDDD